MKGLDFLSKMEGTKTGKNDVPVSSITIVDCGVVEGKIEKRKSSESDSSSSSDDEDRKRKKAEKKEKKR